MRYKADISAEALLFLLCGEIKVQKRYLTIEVLWNCLALTARRLWREMADNILL